MQPGAHHCQRSSLGVAAAQRDGQAQRDLIFQVGAPSRALMYDTAEASTASCAVHDAHMWLPAPACCSSKHCIWQMNVAA